MDFARKQLEKYGWTDGKGLGKNENGISQALKPKLKRSVTGVGHDPASDFNEHWWTSLYDKAAGNLEIKNANGTTKKIKTKEDFKITNNIWQIKQNPKTDSEEQYGDFFVRTAVMSGENKVQKVRDTDSEEETSSKDVFKMTDEELFAACEGRTAHKGARHGLRASGKLARIAEQEKQLLCQSKYYGYSHNKKIKEKVEKVVEEATFYNEDETNNNKSKKKKKKRNRCIISEGSENRLHESDDEKTVNILKFKNIDVADNASQDSAGRKKKVVPVDVNDTADVQESVKEKKKRKSDVDVDKMAVEVDNIGAVEVENIKKKKKKKLK